MTILHTVGYMSVGQQERHRLLFPVMLRRAFCRSPGRSRAERKYTPQRWLCQLRVECDTFQRQRYWVQPNKDMYHDSY